MTTARAFAIAVAILICPAPFAGGAGTGTAHVSAEPIITAEGSLGCRITVKAANASRGDIWLLSEESRVRAEIRTPAGRVWGSWKRLPMSNRRIRPGETATMTAELDLTCNNRRRYEFRFRSGVNSADLPFGGAGTTRTSLDLGSVDRLF